MRHTLMIFVFLVSLFLSGCVSSYRTDYIEGTSVLIGLWIPVNGQVYGLQAFSYLNGKRYRSQTNETFQTEMSLTNSTWGTETKQTSKTTVK